MNKISQSAEYRGLIVKLHYWKNLNILENLFLRFWRISPWDFEKSLFVIVENISVRFWGISLCDSGESLCEILENLSERFRSISPRDLGHYLREIPDNLFERFRWFSPRISGESLREIPKNLFKRFRKISDEFPKYFVEFLRKITPLNLSERFCCISPTNFKIFQWII